MCYGEIAGLLSRPLPPRAVGWALSACPNEVPWHRVVNATGRCSARSAESGGASRQRRRLEAEGVEFNCTGILDLSRYRWSFSL